MSLCTNIQYCRKTRALAICVSIKCQEQMNDVNRRVLMAFFLQVNTVKNVSFSAHIYHVLFEANWVAKTNYTMSKGVNCQSVAYTFAASTKAQQNDKLYLCF